MSGLQPDLFILHSPLLNESSLGFLPPLNYMLKFSGYPQFFQVLISRDIIWKRDSHSSIRVNY